ncbi:MAG TPA: DJ-1/PfpI family protein [Chitinophagaceae bacterium]|jgi:putative intracellular protease/amidase|nr:DJ-1/PfpI family protein [Chitinophagaceae bacterium]
MRSILAIAIALTTLAAKGQQKKILFISTNQREFNNQVNGTFLMEIAHPFNYFKQKGYHIDIVTPAGNAAAIYHTGDTSEALKKIVADSAFAKAIRQTLTPQKAIGKKYNAIFIPGGYGQFIDVIGNESISDLVRKQYESGAAIATVGHGTAVLASLKTSNGNYLVAGKLMTCFPSWAEQEWMVASSFGKALPFDMEQQLRLHGADVRVRTQTNKTKDVLLVDKKAKLVTGSFAFDAEKVAKALHDLLK